MGPSDFGPRKRGLLTSRFVARQQDSIFLPGAGNASTKAGAPSAAPRQLGPYKVQRPLTHLSLPVQQSVELSHFSNSSAHPGPSVPQTLPSSPVGRQKPPQH